jgi:DNA-binding GntR family transcriptional regulator
MEIFYIRGVLSGIAARFALPKLSSKDISDLFKICDQMESFNAVQSHKEMLDINSQFHKIIISATGSPRLIELLDQFYRISSQYRALGLELPGRDEEVCKEHRLIAESLMKKDADKAEFYSREHYFNTARRIAESIGNPISV